MFVMVMISTVAILVAIVGCVVIWGYDAKRAQEVERPRPAAPLPAVAPSATQQRSIDRS